MHLAMHLILSSLALPLHIFASYFPLFHIVISILTFILIQICLNPTFIFCSNLVILLDIAPLSPAYLLVFNASAVNNSHSFIKPVCS